ncbi:hypothetical protein PAXRUDRAFT_170539 [Paxillus rubicundulus Ve08.2h10]|uniref:Uncharacterized protein n=1 Tax=Paxillus rubicundulus Ve08.2h10 TaxID=930991 RepID=A0A0D0BYI6_9AGAM|nr:hypothetical protein PAXRUDRAFT_170539 [Paxillus rubicundulus Ve08.2h10]
MVSDFVSSNQGWCHSPDGQESAQIVFRAEKVQDGWYTNQDILDQTSWTMDLLERHYPELEHVFVFNNAPRHLK